MGYDVYYCNECGGELPCVVTNHIVGTDRDDDYQTKTFLSCDHTKTGRNGHDNVEFVTVYELNEKETASP